MATVAVVKMSWPYSAWRDSTGRFDGRVDWTAELVRTPHARGMAGKLATTLSGGIVFLEDHPPVGVAPPCPPEGWESV